MKVCTLVLVAVLLTAHSALAVKPTVIAVIDTGLDTEHPLTKNNLWINPGESGIDINGNDKRFNRIDDDQNGFVDDVNGWNFIDGNNNLKDTIGHGTHVGGLIIAGAHPKEVRLMVLKYYNANSTPQKNISAYLAALKYAVGSSAKIINYSGGGPQELPEEKILLSQAAKKGQYLVTAMGNENSAIEDKPFFPASYSNSESGKYIIPVEALDQLGNRYSKSNFMRTKRGPAALGENVISSLPGGKLGLMSGTSQATALFTGQLAQKIP